MRDFNREIQFSVRNNFAQGNVSTDLLRPWMTIRYIAVSYGVPQKVLFDGAGVPPRKENSMISIDRLNGQMGLKVDNDHPELLEILRKTIKSYRQNPVATGMIEKGVQDWMSVQYVANSIGIPAEEIFSVIGIPPEKNAFIPIGFLSKQVRYPGGTRSLEIAIQKIVDEHGGVGPK